jgi:hypothetical protein
VVKGVERGGMRRECGESRREEKWREKRSDERKREKE